MADKDTQPMTQNTQDAENELSTNDLPSWGLLLWIGRPGKDTERLMFENF